MSTPISKPSTKLLPFEERLKLVSAEVQVRVASVPANQQNHARARLWCGWIKRQLLPDTCPPSQAIPYIDNPRWQEVAL